jgi:hypothetical protein
MMNKKKKNITIIPLLIITFVVWGVIIYKVIAHFKSGDDASPEVITNVASIADPVVRNTDNAGFIESEYVSLDRDPFVLKRITKVNGNTEQNRLINHDVVQNLPQKQKIDLSQINKIEYAINGVIINNESKLVILEDLTNKKILFMRKGDEYNDIIIKLIDLNKVTLTEKGITKEIEIKK